MAFAIAKLSGNSDDVPEAEEWPTTGLLAILPEPEFGIVHDICEFEDFEEASVDYLNKNMFDTYIEACKEKGFDITDDVGYPESIGSDELFMAFNKDGCRLELSYTQESCGYYDDKEDDDDTVDGIDISIHRAIKDSDISWPSKGVGSTLPSPDSLTGEIISESDTTFIAYITNTDKSEYNEYVSKILNTKYSVDYDKKDEYFYGKDSKSDKKYTSVVLKYWGNKTMIVKIEKNDFSDLYDDEDEEEDEDETDSSSKSSSVSDSTDFRDMMDEYEDFVDDYVSFMEKYKNSKNTSEMISDYSQWVEDYGEWINEIDDIDVDELSSSDYDYYVEVTSRCLDKISDAGL